MKINLSARVTSILLSIVILLAGIAAGAASITTPRPYNGDDGTRFSAVNAASWVKEISRKPHSVFDIEAHNEVLQYLVKELKNMGLEVSLKEYTLRSTDPDSAGPKEVKIYNIHGMLDGKSDDAILLVSHYDSAYNWDWDAGIPIAGESFGAADDGYGVAAILETLRAVKAQNKPLENDLQILITDAEELGLLGAGKEMKENLEAFKNVRLVINLEARGIKGPAVMFETGVNNSALMDYYIKNVSVPFSYSFATDIYRLMPNGTDFTCFMEQGFTGYNLAVLDNLDYYHTKDDNFNNIDISSLQHYGEQILPLVQQFVFVPSDKLPDFKSESSGIFFNISPNVMIHYSQVTGILLLVFAAALFIVFVIRGRRKGHIHPGRVLALTGAFFAVLVVFALFGTLVAYLTSVVFGMKFNIVHLINIPYANFILAGVILLGALTLLAVVRRFVKKSPEGMEPVAAGIMLSILLSILTHVLLPGITYLFTLPALFAAVYGIVSIAVKGRAFNTVILALMSVTLLVVYIPLVYFFNLALTLGAGGITAFFALIGLSMLIPVYNHYLTCRMVGIVAHEDRKSVSGR